MSEDRNKEKEIGSVQRSQSVCGGSSWQWFLGSRGKRAREITPWPWHQGQGKIPYTWLGPRTWNPINPWACNPTNSLAQNSTNSPTATPDTHLPLTHTLHHHHPTHTRSRNTSVGKTFPLRAATLVILWYSLAPTVKIPFQLGCQVYILQQT